jgi:hypothetical protein
LSIDKKAMLLWTSTKNGLHTLEGCEHHR